MQWSWSVFFGEFRPDLLAAAGVLAGIGWLCRAAWRKMHANKALKSFREEAGTLLIGTVLIFGLMWGVRSTLSSGEPDFSKSTVDLIRFGECSAATLKEPMICMGTQVALRNLGADSAVDRFEAALENADATIAGEVVGEPLTMRLSEGRIQRFQPTMRGQALSVSRGQIVHSALAITIPVDMDLATHPASVLVIGFQDGFGTKHSIRLPLDSPIRRRI